MPNVSIGTKGAYTYRCISCKLEFYDRKYYHNDLNLICDPCFKRVDPLQKDKNLWNFKASQISSPEFNEFILEILSLCEDDFKIFNQIDLFLYLAILMTDKNKANNIETLLVRLKIRLELFKRVPTATNMLLAYNLIEEITLKVFSEGKDISDEVNKQIERFDKCKSLALGTKFINERQVAFARSVDVFKKLTNVQL